MSEWLGNIKKQLGQADKFLNENGNQAVEVTVSVMNKLIQQAERVEWLEKELEHQAEHFNVSFDVLEGEKKLIESENQRYKQALEKIAARKMGQYLTVEHMNQDFIKIANDALKEEL